MYPQCLSPRSSCRSRVCPPGPHYPLLPGPRTAGPQASELPVPRRLRPNQCSELPVPRPLNCLSPGGSDRTRSLNCLSPGVSDCTTWPTRTTRTSHPLRFAHCPHPPALAQRCPSHATKVEKVACPWQRLATKSPPPPQLTKVECPQGVPPTRDPKAGKLCVPRRSLQSCVSHNWSARFLPWNRAGQFSAMLGT